jgi:hypothetical protein
MTHAFYDGRPAKGAVMPRILFTFVVALIVVTMVAGTL